ncbi:MAG TPA: OB-fold nucleic acid binding domain-containing protein, partial [Clostridia bacterium]
MEKDENLIPEEPAEGMNEQMAIRTAKLRDMAEAGEDPFAEVVFDTTCRSREIIQGFDLLEGTVVSIAGRIMSKRGMGKVSFCDLQDRDGRIQLFTRIDELGETSYAAWQRLDIGDIVGVRGTVFRTQRGEISVKTSA